MLYFVLIGLCLSLVGVAGFQLTYMFYLDRLDKDRRKRIVHLEHECRDLHARLDRAHTEIERQEELIENLEVLCARGEEAWADVIEEN